MTSTLNPVAKTSAADADPASVVWMLEGCMHNESALTRVTLKTFPFSVGREPSCNLQLASRNVSKRHAILFHTPAAVIVSDQGSTNGTFVNGRRISEPTPVDERDLIQIADVELRLVRQQAEIQEGTFVSNQPEQSWLISRMHEVLNEGRMTIHYQPIVAGQDRTLFGYEALVRTDVPGLESPLKLFESAARLGLEEKLSEACRTKAVRLLHGSGVRGALFLNTHPHEYLGPELIESLRELRVQAGDRQLVLEVHEEAVPEVNVFLEFAAALRQLNIQLAFDDFGVGQSRLLELAHVVPDFVKFDRALLKDLGTAGAAHADLVRSLHDNVAALGITTLAEGIETPESIAACDAIGFMCFQGYAFGRPQPLDAITSSIA